MDDRRFDDLTRALAEGTSRRAALRLLTGGAVGTVLGALGIAEAEAKKKPPTRPTIPPPPPPPVCTAESQARTCHGTQCGDAKNNCQQTVSCGTCSGNRTCQSGTCGCPAGSTLCGTTCTDTRTDPENCGGCGNRCVGGTCIGGQCATAEVRDGVDNDRDGQTDEGSICPQNKVSRNVNCTCAEGQADCDGDGACENLGTNERCAGCGDVCTGGKVCRGGSCRCPDGQRDCNGACTPDGDCCTSTECEGEYQCLSGICRCPNNRPRDCGDGVCLSSGQFCP